MLLAAYLGHLLVPLVFLVDSLRVMHAGAAGAGEKTVVVAGAAWVLVGLSALAFSRDRGCFLEWASGPLIAIYAFFFSVAVLELGIRIGIRRFNRNRLFFKPGTKMVFDLRPWRLPGVSPSVTFSVNALGLRGPMPPDGGRVYRIIALGGSTTECAALDDSQEWPHLLMQAMNDRQKQYFVWVANAGVSGLTTVDHLSCLGRLPMLSQADLLIFLIGVNDLQAALEYGGASTQMALEYKAELFAEHAPPGVTPVGGLFRRTWVFPLGRDGLLSLVSILRRRWGEPAPDAAPQFSEQSRRRAAGPILPLPDLRIGLDEYAQRVRGLERECRARRLRCVFLTQPSMWRTDLPPAEQGLLWFGAVGRQGHPRGYASVADLKRAMDAYNTTLLSVCRQEHLECYDLASFIPKDTSAFYDDVHFNTGGARIVAQFLAARLLSSSPFP